MIGGKLAALEEFKIQKEDYVLQMATLREQIAQQEADHKEEIYRLERKQVVDKDRWSHDLTMHCIAYNIQSLSENTHSTVHEPFHIIWIFRMQYRFKILVGCWRICVLLFFTQAHV